MSTTETIFLYNYIKRVSNGLCEHASTAVFFGKTVFLASYNLPAESIRECLFHDYMSAAETIFHIMIL